MAYQGLGQGLAEDVSAIRLFCEELPEVAIAISCSKNFGLYRERTGCLLVLSRRARRRAQAALSQLVRRRAACTPCLRTTAPRSCIEILADAGLREQWRAELASMRRADSRLASRSGGATGGGLSAAGLRLHRRTAGDVLVPRRHLAQVRALRERHHVYMTDDSRINVAGLRADNLEYFATGCRAGRA